MNILNKKVVKSRDIPKEVLGDFTFSLMRGKFALQCPAYLEITMDEEGLQEPLKAWFRETYPELKDEESFLIRFAPII